MNSRADPFLRGEEAVKDVDIDDEGTCKVEEEEEGERGEEEDEE